MWFKLRSTDPDCNPWLEQDRQEQRKLLATALSFAAAVLFGFGLLIYALMAG